MKDLVVPPIEYCLWASAVAQLCSGFQHQIPLRVKSWLPHFKKREKNDLFTYLHI